MRGEAKKLFGVVGIVVSLLLLTCCFSVSARKVTLHLISHRYPALEFYAQALSEEAPANVEVKSELMPYDKWLEKMRITLAAGSSAYDITYIDPPALSEFAKKGWLIPLNDFIEKYEDEFHFSDIPQSVWESQSYNGKIYAIPHHQLAYILFYRKDIFTEAGLQPPNTLEEYVQTAAKLTNPPQYGSSLTLRVADYLSNEFQAYLTACGGWWFSKDLKPTFHDAHGVMAVIYIKRIMPYAPPGVMNYGNDESMVAMQQGRVAMMNQWSTRASAMNDPTKSKVVGLVDWERPPSLWRGGPPASRFTAIGYAIPAFTKNDPDLIFRTIARATDAETARRGAQFAMPVRLSVTTDPQIIKEHPEWKAVTKAILAGAKDRPSFPEFNLIQEIAMKKVAQALAGEIEIKKALDLAAQEAYKILEEAGYYK